MGEMSQSETSQIQGNQSQGEQVQGEQVRSNSAGIDQSMFRDVLGHYPTGVVIVTGRADDGELLAMVVGTFTSVSLEPPLVAFLPMRSSGTFARLQQCQSLCINVLTGDQEDIGRQIASRKTDKLDGLDWFESPSGDPVLADSLAWLDVRLENTVEAGDHWIVLCRVIDMAVHNPVAPLIFFQGGYGRFVIPPLVARFDDGIISAVRGAATATSELRTLANQIGCEVSLLTAVNRDELAAVVTAVGPGISSAEGLGERVPMVPPIGDTYMSGASSEDQEYWLNKANPADEQQRRIFIDRLEFCRQHGYLLSHLPVPGNGAYATLNHAAHLYASGSLTPAQEREIRERIGASGIDYSLRPIDPDSSYDVGSIVAPLSDAEGRRTLTLRLSQLPGSTSGEQVREWIRQCLETARAIEQRLQRQAA